MARNGAGSLDGSRGDFRRARRLLAGSAALLLATPVLTGATDLTTNLEARVLASHNRERHAVGIPPMRWDTGLAASAKDWADHLAATGAFEHAPESRAGREGENLWAGTRGRFSAEAMVDGWIREKRNYRSGRFPHNSVTGRVADVGHYTQLVWRRTLRVGCAKATGGEDDVLVCRYSEPGNYMGETPY